MSGHTGGSQGWAISFESELALRQKGGSCVRRNTEEQGNISFLPSSGFYSALASHVYGKRWHRSKGKIGQLRAFLLSFLSVQLLSRVRLFATPWIAARQASLSITNSRSLLKLMSIQLVMPSNHLILCRPLLLLPSIFPSIGVFSNESTLRIRGPKYWSFSFSISPSNEYSGQFPLGWTGWISLQSKGLSRVFSNAMVPNHQFFGAQPSL